MSLSMGMDLQARFDRLDALLSNTAHWWQPRLFEQRDYPWRHACPELVSALEALTSIEVERLQNDPETLSLWLRTWVPEAETTLALTALPRSAVDDWQEVDERLSVGVPGRKWQQVMAFAQAWRADQSPLLEWCSGKGHLGRVLAAQSGCSVSSLEWQQALCLAGTELAAKQKIAQQFLHADALAADAAQALDGHDQAVALHACGDLHLRLMQHWSRSTCERLAMVPCCYHLIAADGYVPISKAARASALQLSRYHLSFCLQSLVTAGGRARRLREQELLWRMAFDEWQREIRGVDEYLPVATISERQLSGAFIEFVAHMAVVKQLPGPDAKTWDEAQWLARGQLRQQRLARMELVVSLFRRPLELWLLLDRALFLRQSGARVELIEFCEPALTPRNVMIVARR